MIYLNQSGFNLGKPKRFTAPTLPNGTAFMVVNVVTSKTVFKGVIKGHIGDFSALNPKSTDEFVIKAAGEMSFPFRIGNWWLERVTYQNAVDFMIGSRHYVGTYKEPCRGSFGWRDDHHFGWELNTLVPQYLSNPSAYQRMPKKIRYEAIPGKIGALEPYDKNAPDIVKLIHFGADIIVTQKVGHELLKEQLAFFLYAWPYIKQWLPEQNYKAVSDFAFAQWSVSTIKMKYPYDTSKGHDILKLKTAVGTTKGELPPGHTVLPNLLMYEVAKREKRKDAEKYFKAAFRQVKWMVKELDWNDPLTTKGQRMSEHVTMTGLAHMLKEYPDLAPSGLKSKIEEWKQVACSRSNNMWDFRKLSDTQWCPTGPKKTMWNEPGNLVGFPACALAAMEVTPGSKLNGRLEQLVYAQMDNAFGRNPTSRHTCYHGPRDIEGVDLGWYSFHVHGIGKLKDCVFVIEASAKNEHYPYNPQIGNISWSEGWVTFNSAYNISLAYMARHDTRITIQNQDGKLLIRLKAPINFDYQKVEQATVQLSTGGKMRKLVLKEESANSAWFSALITPPNTPLTASYGHGYCSKNALWSPTRTSTNP